MDLSEEALGGDALELGPQAKENNTTIVGDDLVGSEAIVEACVGNIDQGEQSTQVLLSDAMQQLS